MKYRKKPVVIDATQWFKNGDHPLDHTKENPNKDWEGLIVRYYRTPDLDGKDVCRKCGNIMHVHGWLDTQSGGDVVCPGDYVITETKNEYYPCKPDIFEATYERVVGVEENKKNYTNRNDRIRPYDGQAHTVHGARGKTIIDGLTMRDLVDCIIKGFLSASNIILQAKVTAGTWEYEDVYKVDSDYVDFIAVTKNTVGEVERMMGIYPNTTFIESMEPKDEELDK